MIEAGIVTIEIGTFQKPCCQDSLDATSAVLSTFQPWMPEACLARRQYHVFSHSRFQPLVLRVIGGYLSMRPGGSGDMWFLRLSKGSMSNKAISSKIQMWFNPN